MGNKGQRGGRQPGAGRPIKEGGYPKVVIIRMTKEDRKKLDQMTRKISEFMRRLVREEYERYLEL